MGLMDLKWARRANLVEQRTLESHQVRYLDDALALHISNGTEPLLHPLAHALRHSHLADHGGDSEKTVETGALLCPKVVDERRQV